MRKTFCKVIPPNPVKFYGLIICALVSGYLFFRGVEFQSGIVADPWFLCIVCTAGAVLQSKNYVLDTEKISVRILIFTVAESKWQSVREIIVADKSNNDPKTKGEALFVVVPDCCQSFDPNSETISQYCTRTRGFVTKIPVERKKKDKYVGYFQSYFDRIHIYP